MSRPIVFLHGFTGHADAWDDVRSHLPGRRIDALTLYGHDGTRPAAPIGFVDEVDRVVARLRELGEPARLCGYSMGGRLTLGVLARAPELVASAVIIGAHPGLESEEERRQRVAADEVWATMLEREPLDVFIERWQAQPLFASQRAMDPSRLERQRRRRLAHDPIGLAFAMRSLGLGVMPSYWDELTKITVPLQIVVGGLDAKFTGLAQRLLARLPPNKGALVSVPDTGHNVVVERPDALSRILADGEG